MISGVFAFGIGIVIPFSLISEMENRRRWSSSLVKSEARISGMDLTFSDTVEVPDSFDFVFHLIIKPPFFQIWKHDRKELCRESRFAAWMFESSIFFSFLILSLISGTTTHWTKSPVTAPKAAAPMGGKRVGMVYQPTFGEWWSEAKTLMPVVRP